MRTTTLLLALLASTQCAAVTAQAAPPVSVGDRVRVTAPALNLDKRTGAVVAVDNVTLTLDTLRVALASVTRLELSQGQKSNTAKGAIIGLVVGGVAGVVVGAASHQQCVPQGVFSCVADPGAGTAALGGAVVFGLGGLVVGLVVGGSKKTDRWQEVPLDRFGVTLAPQRRGRFSLAFSVRF